MAEKHTVAINCKPICREFDLNYQYSPFGIGIEKVEMYSEITILL